MFSYAVNVIIAVVVCLAGFCHVTRADCNVTNFNVQPNFNITAYAGTWYEINFKPPYYAVNFSVWMDYYEQYTLDNSTGTPQLNLTVAGRDADDNYKCVGGSDTPLQIWNLNTPAKMYSVQQINATNTINQNHWVIGTDYVTYAVIYGCFIQNTDGTCKESTAKVHSRTRTITDTTVLGTINSLLNSVCLNITMLPPVWQNATLCPETTTTALPNNATTSQPTTTTKASGTELMASLSTLLLTMLLLVVNYQRHDAAV